MAIEYDFDWSDLAFGNKKKLKDLQAVFIAAPRELSVQRLTQIIKAYLPKGNIVLGIAKESHIAGFETQPQFRTLQASPPLQAVLDKVRASASPHKIYTLHYFQRELQYILEKGDFRQAVFVNGSWQHAFHHREAYYTLANNRIDYELISPFADEDEARRYETATFTEAQAMSWPRDPDGPRTDHQMMKLAGAAAKLSFDHTFQCGAILARSTDVEGAYTYVAHSYNKVVPYQTYAWHHGSERERHFTPVNDLSHYDTVHAEAMLLIEAQRRQIDLTGTTLFINLLPCPHCTRMLTQTAIAEVVYAADHSDGYAHNLLSLSGKSTRRLHNNFKEE